MERMRDMRHKFVFPLRVLQGWLLAPAILAGVVTPVSAEQQGRHFAVNLGGQYADVVAVGFDLADISSAAKLDDLPQGLRGVLWLGNGYNKACEWRLDDAQVTVQVEAARDHPNFSGIYYISDEPHPKTCPDAPAHLAERTALIHALDPAGRTFIIVQNGSNGADEFGLLSGSADLIGVDPYPCNHRNTEKGCDFKQLRDRIHAALAAGITVDRIVPVFQAFGQSCADIKDPWYRLPTSDEMSMMLEIWDELVPPDRRAFDMTYSWAPQKGTSCPTLALADGGEFPNLRQVFSDYFASMGAFGVVENHYD